MESIVTILADQLSFEEFARELKEGLFPQYPADLTAETSLFSDVGIDSLEVFHVVVFIEDLTGEEIALDDPPPLDKVRDVYSFYLSLRRASLRARPSR